MEVTYTKLQLDAAGQTKLLEQTSDQTMMAKQGETSFVIHGQDGKASTAVDQKWHMISAEQVGDSGSVIWQHADTGAFRETKYSIDKNQKTWTQSGETQELNTSELYAREGQHKADLNGDGFQSSSALSLKGPGNQQQGSSEIMLEGDGLISSTNKVVGQWKADRNTEYSIEGNDKALFCIDNNGEVRFTGDSFAPEASKANGPTAYEITVKATDKSTNQSVSQTIKLQQRHVIEVTNNAGDTREGSFGWAVELANKLGAKNAACEIRFKESMTIESKNGYRLTHGDVKINTYDSKNVSIKRKSNGSAFTIGEYEYANKHDVDKQPDLRVEASNINIFNTTAKGQDAAKNGGGGGGYGTGAGVLHYNGHLTWSNSVVQGNKVVGGHGAGIASNGKGGSYYIAGSGSGARTVHRTADRGDHGLRGGGINDRNHSFGNQKVDGGAPGKVDPYFLTSSGRDNHGKKGSNAPNSAGLGEGGIGPGAGGGGEYPRANDVFNYKSNKGNTGKPGKGSKAGYGGGQAAQGSGKIDDSDTREWGGTSESNKGGRGSAQGAFLSSLAHKNDKNSVTIRSTDALGNEAQSSSSAGKTKNINSRYIEIKIDNYRQSDNRTAPDMQRETVQVGTHNTDHNVDRSNAFNNSGKFTQAEHKEPTSIAVRSKSFVVKENEANIVGQTIDLDPNKSHVIFLGMQLNGQNSVTSEIQNWQQWRDGISGIMQKVYSVKTEQQIRNSRKGFIQTWGSTLLQAAGQAGATTGPASLMFNVTKGIGSEISEDRRIEKELKDREATIEEQQRVESHFVEALKTNPIQVTDVRTRPLHNNFSLGTHTIEFQPGLDPLLKWESVKNGQAIISVNNRDFNNRTADNKAKQFSLFKLTKEQTKEMENIENKSAYLNSFIQFRQEAGNGFISARMGTQTKWLFVKNNAQDPQTGNSNDRVAIQRDYGAGLTDKTNLVVDTFQGNDVIQGDRGNSTINAGRGDDYIQPGLGKDIVKGGEGIDTVSYANIEHALKARVENGKVTVKFDKPAKTNTVMDDKVSGVEKFIFGKNANIDLKGLAPAVKYSTTDPNRTTNHQVTRTIMFNEGSTFKGSAGDEKIIVGFVVKEGAPSTVDSIKKVSIDGRGGRDTVVINGLDSHLENGHKVSIDRTKKEVNLIKGDSKKTIVSYQNIMGDPTVITKDNQVIEPELNPSKPAVEEVKKVDPSVSPLTQSDAEPTTTSASASADQPMMVDSLTGNTVKPANNVTGTAPQLKAGTDSLTGETMTNADADSSDWTPMHPDAGLSEGSANHSRNLLAAQPNGINSNNEFNTHPETLSVLEVDPIPASIAGQPVISDPLEAVGADATFRSTSTPAGVIEMV
ncbi:hypothetical protein MITS9509_01473 [Synechococcus sp. MIT S9509]|uniref:hypothetical protein n=1 Tax=Synechococcus sp. MIT S9509 TaxID=1801630 RepID=UPI0007BB1C53|nr:hypothetical protein [Synechococcus sp. MIT S9509]KZR92482.1 hypothetical protein MITS9509_01473 [Synechococcus sp. MIT S9509]